MDSLENSASMRKPLKINCDNEKNRNCKGTPRQRVQTDNTENVFTSMPNQTESSCDPSNGPRPGGLNPVPSGEPGRQPGRLSENSSECYNNISGASQSQMCNRLNSSHADQPEASGSGKADTCDKGVELSSDAQACQRHKVCMDKVGNNSYNLNAPSTSGTSKACDSGSEVSGFRENRKRPSSLKLNRPNFDAEDSSSDTGNDDYSLGSEDGCIYTYRGGEHLADLPSSFFSLDMGLPLDKHLPLPPGYPVPQQAAPNVREQGSRASSPDMDFLEMDFDPGPSCEVDTGDESTPDTTDLDDASNMPEENEPVLRRTSPEYLAGARQYPLAVNASESTASHSDAELQYFNVPSTSRGIVPTQGDVRENTRSSHSYGRYIMHVNVRGEQLLVRRTISHWPDMPISLHVSNGDLVSPREILYYEEEHPEGSYAYQINQGERPTFDSANLTSALYHLTMAKRLMIEKAQADIEEHNAVFEGGEPGVSVSSSCDAASAAVVEPPRRMVWSEREACERQVTQIGTSACGATAVVNVFVALGIPINLERINSAIGTRQRANNAPLPRYLMSRAVAGCTAADLVSGIQRASDGLVTARFFPTYPERAISLSHWLADWISLGAVPILTLNLQVCCEMEIPDAWHHQMVFGVSPRGVYLCNPVECVRECILWPRLRSPSVLLVRTRDVLARFTAHTDLTPLMAIPDQRFHSFNVLGQVVNVIREWRATGWSEHGTRTRHVRIPASYQAGVTVVALTGSEAHRRLMHAPQLPLLDPRDPAGDASQ